MAKAQTYPGLSNSGVEQPVESDLPTGTVTFLLSDVEGSTRLWESEAEEAPVLIARHYELLDAAIVLHGGLRPVEQGEGDSVVGVFACASDAVAAALDVQRAFANEPWPGESPLRIRVALHTGEAQLRDAGNYFGPTVIRCARLRATAHGGQTIVSDATRDLVVDALPEGGELRDLGSHRLKDLGRAERVWQFVHPDLPDDFAPLRSLSVLPTNLPLQLSSFVGRDTEVLELADALDAPSPRDADGRRRVWKDASCASDRGRDGGPVPGWAVVGRACGHITRRGGRASGRACARAS